MQSAIARSETRPGYRPYATTISSIVDLTPNFVRVTVTGETLGDFGTDGLDQRIKLVLPFDDGTTTDLGANDDTVLAEGSWYARWRDLPDESRNPIRTYTVRAVRPDRREVDIDVVRHAALPGTTLGPAARWIKSAAVGDELLVVGPDVTSALSHIGIDWQPGDATRLLLVGDETAVPAACAVIAQLPPTVRVDALFEIPTADDELPIETAADARITWLPRDAAPEGTRPGELLVPALEAWVAANPGAYASARAAARQELADIDVDRERLWDSPELRGDEVGHRSFYAWLAGEQSAIKRMRRHLVTDAGIDRGVVSFMGYWRFGVADLG